MEGCLTVEESPTPSDDAQREPAPTSVAAIVRDALDAADLTSTNEAAESLLQARAEDGTLGAHMADGAVRSLADDLIRTCQEASDDD